MNVQINIDEIEKAMLQLFNELRNLKGNIVELEPVDFYWAISGKDLYNPYIEPQELTLGQISDDLLEMQKIADNKIDPVTYDFVKLSSILAAIGYKTI